jgi:hypothetical protein
VAVDVIFGDTIRQADHYRDADSWPIAGLLLRTRIPREHKSTSVSIWLGAELFDLQIAESSDFTDSIRPEGDTRVSVDVTNAGKIHGEEVVQL